ncbi:MAG: type II secretion system GspH family protein [Campylobacteraceae bacterium]|jgi:prepilin-type N-terminal cleavage/methylation domain-containing protein|nr:type II secretion system GspH family protein [Campylobacteraceae bacterium]
MKRGFTMIELIFVIVILGIMAAVAIPKLAASRDDAAATAIKQDVATATSAVPAWYTGQRDARIDRGMSLDKNRWAYQGTGDTGYDYAYIEAKQPCVVMQVLVDTVDVDDDGNPILTDNKTTSKLQVATDKNTDDNGLWQSDNGARPVLVIKRGKDEDNKTASGPVCSIIWDNMNLQEQTIEMGGNRVRWQD